MHYLDKPADVPISPQEIEAFKNDIRRNDTYRIMIETPPTYEERQKNIRKQQTKAVKVTIEGIYPFIVQTNLGSFQYGELLSAIRRYRNR